jgi:hypothetical protein
VDLAVPYSFGQRALGQTGGVSCSDPGPDNRQEIAP